MCGFMTNGIACRNANRRRKVIIIGAGLAGLSAAHHLLASEISADLIVLEASQRIGGRIMTTQMGSDLIEMGATWIQGTEGSPLYAISMKPPPSQPLQNQPFERQDGFPPEPPIVKAEGGHTVDYSTVVAPLMSVYDDVLMQIRSPNYDGASWSDSVGIRSASIGEVVRQAFNEDYDQSAAKTMKMKRCLEASMAEEMGIAWSLRSLQEAVVRSKEHMERVETAADALSDLDLAAEHEYRDYPGQHLTIAAGYGSVIRKLAASLPHSALHFAKHVQTIAWNQSQLSSSSSSADADSAAAQSITSPYPVLVTCSDGSLYEADHVIVTFSLGVLKASVQLHHQQLRRISTPTDGELRRIATPMDGELSRIATPMDGEPRRIATPTDSDRRRIVCRSIYDLPQSRRLSTPILPHGVDPASPPPLFSPPLPSWKADAISKLGYGVVDKLFLHLNPNSPHFSDLATSHFHLLYHPEDDDSNAAGLPTPSAIPWWMRKTFSIAPIYKGSSVLLLWFAGGEALEMEALSDEEIMSGVEKTLASFGIVKLKQPQKLLQEAAAAEQAMEALIDEDDGRSDGGSPMFSSASSSASSTAAAAREETDQSSSDSEQEGGYGYSRYGAEEEEEEEEEVEECGREYYKISASPMSKMASSTPIFSGVMRSQWGRDPLFHGSYSYVATGASGEDIEAVAAPLPAPPLSAAEASLQLLFAGEATERHFYSTTHGAFLSGVREANRLLHHLSNSNK